MTRLREKITFEPHGHRLKSEGKIGDTTVVVIIKNKNHTHTNKGIYTVNVCGEELHRRFRAIDEAREAARSAFAARAPAALTDEIVTLVLDEIIPRPFHTGDFIDSLRAVKPEVWSSLLARYGEGGQGAGTYYSAFSAVAHALHRAAGRGVLDKLDDYVAAPPHLNWGSPVIRYWTGPGGASDQPYPDELSPDAYYEGAVIEVKVNRYERSRSARAACIGHYLPICQGCGLDFSARYGERGKDFMHVHHLVPLKQIKKTYEVDPIAHLRPICPNCHAMIHRREPMLSIEELRAILK
ncbi:HNH endonuclease [Rhizobium sp. AG855]|nr:HNH endonuclease [Rhizobium sp. AG855]